MTKNELWSERDESELVEFCVEKCRNVTFPFNIRQLCEEFKETSGTNRTVECLQTRISLTRAKIHKRTNIDMETKIKLIYGLKTPIDKKFLKEIFKNADVILNKRNQIVKYQERRQGGLKLNVYHNTHNPETSLKRDEEMLKLLEELSVTREFPISDVSFVNKFKESTGSSEEINSLKYRYRLVKNRIFECSELDMDTRINMMYISSTRVSDNVHKEILKWNVNVEIDSDGRIKMKYDNSTKKDSEDVKLITQTLKELKKEITEDSKSIQILRIPKAEDVEELLNDDNSMSLQKFLKILLSIIGPLNSPKLIKLQSEIEKAVSESDHNIPLEIISNSLDNILLFATKFATNSIANEHSTCLNKFLTIVETATFTMSHVDFKKTLRAHYEEASNKRIPINKIRYAIDYVLEMVLR
ncbi:hypothetical protein CRE_28777 [Caenorhabditis remanei]|uniref:SPK domain-containing protein n=1 Tax=Caenorhabditis remanei TaxID=31234 RepID=E3MK02_CAERE|nr:hypothetical protein CRE_28777 [Caenorhabditis remanei]